MTLSAKKAASISMAKAGNNGEMKAYQQLAAAQRRINVEAYQYQ